MSKKFLIALGILFLLLLLAVRSLYEFPIWVLLFLAVLFFTAPILKFDRNKKMIFFLAMLIAATIYLAIPKKIGGGGVLSDREVITTIKCIGIPYNIMMAPVMPKCLGKETSRENTSTVFK